ncbi:hypothetical protein ACFLMD_004240 [Vibrio vulnificus]
MPEAAFGNTLTATNNDESETSSNNEAPKTSHGARNSMGPRVREDDKNKKRKSRAKFNGKEQKTQHTAATPPTVIPAHAGIHTPTHARSRVGNTLTATDNDESEASSNTDNEVPKTSHGARYPMGPRVREDDEVRELIRTTSNTNNKALKPSYSARYPMGPRVREDDKNKKRKSRAKFNGKEQKTQHTAATPPTVIPAHAGIHTPTHARSRVGNALAATNNN